MNHEPTPDQRAATFTHYPSDHARPMMSVRRSSGEIESGWIPIGEGVEIGTDGEPRAFTRLLKSQGEDVLSKDVLTEELQELNGRLAEERRQRRAQQGKEVAGRAIGHASVASPEQAGSSLSAEDRLKEILEKYDELTQLRIKRYVEYALDKAYAQQMDDGEGSIRYGQYAGQEYQGLSDDAKRDADRYLGIAQSLETE